MTRGSIFLARKRIRSKCSKIRWFISQIIVISYKTEYYFLCFLSLDKKYLWKHKEAHKGIIWRPGSQNWTSNHAFSKGIPAQNGDSSTNGNDLRNVDVRVHGPRRSSQREGPVPGVGQGMELVVAQKLDHLAARFLDAKEQVLVDFLAPLLGLLLRVSPGVVGSSAGLGGRCVDLDVARPRGREGRRAVPGDKPPEVSGNSCRYRGMPLFSDGSGIEKHVKCNANISLWSSTQFLTFLEIWIPWRIWWKPWPLFTEIFIQTELPM